MAASEFERRLCRRQRSLGEGSEGAVEAPADGSGMGEHVVMIYGRE
jgi:hypothetical protein